MPADSPSSCILSAMHGEALVYSSAVWEANRRSVTYFLRSPVPLVPCGGGLRHSGYTTTRGMQERICLDSCITGKHISHVLMTKTSTQLQSQLATTRHSLHGSPHPCTCHASTAITTAAYTQKAAAAWRCSLITTPGSMPQNQSNL